jgi:hypothetical protein
MGWGGVGIGVRFPTGIVTFPFSTAIEMPWGELGLQLNEYRGYYPGFNRRGAMTNHLFQAPRLRGRGTILPPPPPPPPFSLNGVVLSININLLLISPTKTN